jgi:thiol:disulfide interchange protein DsbD
MNLGKIALFLLLVSGMQAAEVLVPAAERTSELVFGSFLAGLLQTFTPCVLPMVPILSSIIVGQGTQLSKTKSVILSISYVFGTAVTYALMGALAGATGEQLQSYFQNSWAIGAVSLLFLLMALSMFGLYTIALPPAVQTRLNTLSAKIKGGSIPMVFLLGMLSALVLGACVSPILIAFLGVAIAQGSAWLGAVTMFFMALGMGVPLILLGFGMGHLLPKAGIWMERIKYIFGVLLLATAIYIFNTVELLPPLLLWGAFLIVLSVYMGALEPLGAAASGWRKFLKGLGVIAFLWGILLLIGAAYGQKDPFHPVSLPIPVNGTLVSDSDRPRLVARMTDIENLQQFEEVLQKAKKQGKELILFFHSDTCGSCKKIKAITFRDPEVVAMLDKSYLLAGVDITHHSHEGTQAVKRHFKVFGPPTFIFFNKDGEVIQEQRLYGYQGPEEFLDILELLAD